MGAEQVTLAYRRSKEDMGAYGFEYATVLSSGAQGMFNAQPLEILGNGTATGVKFIRTEVQNGKLENVPGSEFVIDCDLVIKATGQAKHGSFLSMIESLELDDRKRIIVNEADHQTGNPKYFAGGDAVNGGAEVVNGAAEGKLAANGIHQWLTQQNNG